MHTIILTVPSVGSMMVTATRAQLNKLLEELSDVVPGRVIHYKTIA